MDKTLYQRPNKPRTMLVTKRREAPEMAFSEVLKILTVDQHTECHVTPLEIAQRMVNYLGSTDDYLTLEPSAGTGNLLQALFDSGHSQNELVAIERDVSLCAEM